MIKAAVALVVFLVLVRLLAAVLDAVLSDWRAFFVLMIASFIARSMLGHRRRDRTRHEGPIERMPHDIAAPHEMRG